MSFNIFEGARRIAILLAGIATAATLIALYTHEPYVSAHYSISRPGGPFVRTDGDCPPDAGRHYFSSSTSTGKDVAITLCLLAMSFGQDNTRLIPYKVDEKGMVWGAASYSSEVSAYEKALERRFKLAASDEAALQKEVSRRYRENWLSGLGYLAVGLAVFAGSVWATGWIVRGFLGIPRGLDKRPD